MVLKELSTIYNKLSFAFFTPLRETLNKFYHNALKYALDIHFQFYIRILP